MFYVTTAVTTARITHAPKGALIYGHSKYD